MPSPADDPILKRSRAALKGGFTEEAAAEATAEAINNALGEQMASKADLDRAVDQLGARLSFMQWQIGVIAAPQLATLVKLFVY